MHDQVTRIKRVETLRGLLERLGAPDLTLSEASSLRGQVVQFLDEVVWAEYESKDDHRVSAPSR